MDRMKALAERRQLSDLTIGPVLTHTTAEILEHTQMLLDIPGAKLMFGGKEYAGGDHTVPEQYGMVEPTAVYVPIEQLMSDEHFSSCCKEIFGPFQVTLGGWIDSCLMLAIVSQ